MPIILISGAGIGGPVLAWWLSRAGWSCTIVERDSSPRLTGQQIDIRGMGTTIVQEMGLVEAIRKASVKEKGMAWVDKHGRRRASFPVGEGGSQGGFSSEIEILRGELAGVFIKAAEESENVRIIYGDRVVELHDKPDGVDVTFKTGAAWGGVKTQTFDVVVAADGMHSLTRRLMFPELGRMPIHSLDQYMAYFTIPLDPVADQEMWALWANSPGGRLTLIRPDLDRNRTSAYLGICSNKDANHLFADYYKLSLDEQRQAWKSLFVDAAKDDPITARVVKGVDSAEAEDFYMQEIAQVRLDSWTRGRMALVGDAAACPSPISGQGTTVAIVGAYFMALELAKHPHDPMAGLKAYEAAMRPVVKSAQQLMPGAPQIINPQTSWGIAILHAVLGFVAWTGIIKWFEGDTPERAKIPAWTVPKA